jgi:hypothetical protein
MSKRRRLAYAAILAACLALMLAALVLLVPSRHGVTKANYDRIVAERTTLEKSQNLFGREANLIGSYAEPPNKASLPLYIWISNDGSNACLVFDSNGKLMQGWWHDSTESIGDKLRRVFHWPWW